MVIKSDNGTTIHFSTTRDLRDQLGRMANGQERSLSSVINEIILNSFKKQRPVNKLKSMEHN